MREWVEFDQDLWRKVVYVCVRGHQRIPDVLALSISDFNRFYDELIEIQRREPSLRLG